MFFTLIMEQYSIEVVPCVVLFNMIKQIWKEETNKHLCFEAVKVVSVAKLQSAVSLIALRSFCIMKFFLIKVAYNVHGKCLNCTFTFKNSVVRQLLIFKFNDKLLFKILCNCHYEMSDQPIKYRNVSY